MSGHLGTPGRPSLLRGSPVTERTIALALDLETEGTDLDNHLILECYAKAYYLDTLEPVDTYEVHLILGRNYMSLRVPRWAPVVQDMHKASGLLEELPNHYAIGNYTLDTVLTGLIRMYPPGLRLLGNSVQFDKEFLRRDCPVAHGLLSHRIVDVSTYRDTWKAWGLPVPEGVKAHRAKADVESSIEQLRYFRNATRQGNFPVGNGVNLC